MKRHISKHDLKAKEVSNKEHVKFIFGFYNIPKSWDYWADKQQLMAKEAIPLMCGMTPDIWEKRESYRPNIADPQWENWVSCIKRNLEVSKLDGTIKQIKTSAEWLDWGRVNGLDKPLLKSNSELHEPDICMWSPFASAVHKIEKEDRSKGKAEPEQPKPQKQTRIIDNRVNAIVKQATVLEYDLQSIPYGGKKKIKDKCLNDARLFTESTFDKAWQEASRQGLVKVENVENYRKRD